MKKIMMCLLAFMAVSGIWADDDSVELSKLQNNFAKWQIVFVNKLGSKDGYIQMILTSGTPMFYTPEISIDADKIKYLTFKMKLPDKIKLNGNILFITPDDKKWNDEKNVVFECFSDGEIHDYKVDMSKNKNWKGPVTQIRFTPVYLAGFGAKDDSKKYLELGDGFTDTLLPYSWKSVAQLKIFF